MRCKHVINVADGSLLGHIIDLVFDIRTSRILGFVVPGCRSSFNFFKSPPEIFIPYCNICKIGEDVVLVEVHNLPSRHKRIKVLNDAKTLGSPAGQYQNPQDYENVTATNKPNTNPNIKNTMEKGSSPNYYIGDYETNDGKDDIFLNK
jgi:YlmC/YmxH family sporulation protein